MNANALGSIHNDIVFYQFIQSSAFQNNFYLSKEHCEICQRMDN